MTSEKMYFFQIYTFCYILTAVYSETSTHNNSTNASESINFYKNGTKVMNYIENKLGKPEWEHRKYTPAWNRTNRIIRWKWILDSKKFINNEVRRAIYKANIKIQDFPYIMHNVDRHLQAKITGVTPEPDKKNVKLNQYIESSEIEFDSNIVEKAIKILVEFKENTLDKKKSQIGNDLFFQLELNKLTWGHLSKEDTICQQLVYNLLRNVRPPA